MIGVAVPPVRPDKTVADPPLAESSEGETDSESPFVPPSAGLRWDIPHSSNFVGATGDGALGGI